MAVITTDFGEIQTRNIDPHSPVTSENHNKLLKTFGTHKMYVSGFDISCYVDASDTNSNKKVLANITAGTAYVQYMVIEMTSDATLEICELPTNAKELFVVLEYTYRAVKPVPIAYLKVIRAENYTPANQLKLYSITTTDWTSNLYNATLLEWLADPDHFTDFRNCEENTPVWANNTYLRLDGANIATTLKINAVPKDGNDVVNKAYVDNLMYNHNDAHENAFVRKYDDPEDADTLGKVKDQLDVYLPNPFLNLCDSSNDNNNGLKITAQSDTVRFDLTKSQIQIWSPNMDKAISTIDSYGVTGAIWSDIAEYFDTDMAEMPEQGSCICVKDGKAVLSTIEADTSVVGCVSYKPAYILGGTTNFKKEFEENHKIPVAIVGQIREVKVYADTDIYSGALLISGKNGEFKAILPSMCNGSHIGKVLVPVHKGHGKYYCLIK